MEERYLAHISQDGREQTIREHLHNTARLCGEFAAEFGAEELGELAGLSHDIGKYSREFQHRLCGGVKVDHSTAGAVECALNDQPCAAFCAMGHHSGLPDLGSQGDFGGSTFHGRLRRAMEGGICDYSPWSREVVLNDRALTPVFAAESAMANTFFIRMLYSCLVDADYLDTETFMAGAPVPRGANMDTELLNDLLDKYIGGWFPPGGELNERRCAILEACMSAGESHKPGLFTLTVPTGGGKTIASLAFALRHARRWGKRRIVYVIPYTSIIEQTAAEFRKVLGAEYVLEHHSGVQFDIGDDYNAGEMRRALAVENWDMPVVVTTAVQFFESLYSNRSSKCRKLHNLANSVIIFDEAQMLPLSYLKPCVSAIAQLVENYGVSAVLCTATQPALDGLFRKYLPSVMPVEICPNELSQGSVFKRVTFKREGVLSWAAVAERMNAQEQALCIVNSRANAHALFKLLKEDGSSHLSTLMTPAHRKEVIDEVRLHLAKGLHCRIVSTSLIEAGVDVDFGTVFREEAGLDSILQAAGRCNRNGKRSARESIVTVFTAESRPPELFATGIAAGRIIMDDGMELSNPDTIRRYFKTYLKMKGEEARDMRGIMKQLESGAHPFKTVSEQFKLIENNMRTVYIPLGEGETLIKQRLQGDVSKGLMRKLGLYGVSVYEQHFEALCAAGDVKPLDDESGILENLNLYDRRTGLSLISDAGRAEFV